MAVVLNSDAMQVIWNHVFDENNPHNINAGDIDSNLDGKSVEEILRIIIGDLNDHVGAGNNPHNVTAVQVSQNNSQNALGYNVQNALNKLKDMIREHENETGNVHGVVASQVNMAPPSDKVDGETVQDALEEILKCFKESEFGDDHLQLIEADGNETLILVRRISSEDVAGFHHGGEDTQKPITETEVNAKVGELLWEPDGSGLWTTRSNGVLIKIGGENVLFDAPQDDMVYARRNGEWFTVTATMVQDEKPENPTIGELWADTGYTGELYVYTGSDWVSMTGGGSGGGAVGDNTEDAIPNGLVDKGLVREIDEDGDGYNVSPQLQTSSRSASRLCCLPRGTSRSLP